jgi:hypothetical protein
MTLGPRCDHIVVLIDSMLGGSPVPAPTPQGSLESHGVAEGRAAAIAAAS